MFFEELEGSGRGEGKVVFEDAGGSMNEFVVETGEVDHVGAADFAEENHGGGGEGVENFFGGGAGLHAGGAADHFGTAVEGKVMVIEVLPRVFSGDEIGEGVF